MAGKSLNKHLREVDVMKKVPTVRVVKDRCHGEPGMEGNQGDQLNANNCDLLQVEIS